MADDEKFYPIPYHYDASALQEANLEGKSILANYEAMVDAMRKREEAAMAQRLGDHRVIETTNADGEKVMFVMREPDDLKVRMPMAMTFDLPVDPMRFVLGQQLGGFVARDPMVRVITVTSMPMPQVPGVEAMLADGWVWTGWRFARDQEPAREWGGVVVVYVEDFVDGRGDGRGDSVFVRTVPDGDHMVGQYRRDDADGGAVLVPELRWVEFWKAGDEWMAKVGKRTTVQPGPYAGVIGDRRVLAGRYADRLPTNRRRKRERAKARRRARPRTMDARWWKP